MSELPRLHHRPVLPAPVLHSPWGHVPRFSVPFKHSLGAWLCTSVDSTPLKVRETQPQGPEHAGAIASSSQVSGGRSPGRASLHPEKRWRPRKVNMANLGLRLVGCHTPVILGPWDPRQDTRLSGPRFPISISLNVCLLESNRYVFKSNKYF